MPHTPERPRRIRVQRNGPLLVEGPVEVVGEDGEVTVSRRFTVAVCTCRRTRTPPWCDTSHRCRIKRDEGDKGGMGFEGEMGTEMFEGSEGFERGDTP